MESHVNNESKPSSLNSKNYCLAISDTLSLMVHVKMGVGLKKKATSMFPRLLPPLKIT